MRTRHVGTAMTVLALVGAAALPAAAAGPGPGHALPNTPGMNVIGTAGSVAPFSLAFTGHTDKAGNAHGSIDYVNGDVVLTDLQLSKLAVMDEQTAAAGGCDHGAMVIARGQAQMEGVGPVRIWVDLQDRDEGDRLRVRVRAMADDHGAGCGGHEDGEVPGGSPGGSSDGHTDGTDDGHTDDGHDPGGHDDGHTDGTDDGHTDDGHDPAGHDDGHDSGWLHNSRWQPVKSVKVIMKGYVGHGR